MKQKKKKMMMKKKKKKKKEEGEKKNKVSKAAQWVLSGVSSAFFSSLHLCSCLQIQTREDLDMDSPPFSSLLLFVKFTLFYTIVVVWLNLCSYSFFGFTCRWTFS